MTLRDCCRDIREHEPLAGYTSFRTGGPARWLAQPADEAELLALLDFAEQNSLPHTVIGRGSNLLAADAGYDGLVIRVAYGSAAAEGPLLRADAGIRLGHLFELALEQGFTGLEFAAGIPGSLGGAIFMNAGAYGGEMKDVVHSVRWREPGGRIHEMPLSDLQFGYRTSRFSTEGGTVLSVLFSLPRGDTAQSRLRQAELMQRRRDRQPLDLPSAGSTFKRPPGAFAGPLIEACGLRGARIGGAAVSHKHAGFVVNDEGACSADIYRLIQEVRRTVEAETGITLEPEVRLLGDFCD
ncbi:MAG: UDP-N-acetylmuramate dehydrogenase [Clostridia bacterium]|nr:UDP-N-acetylmuramate dehydrogenase [Clostridia bacterium]